MVKKRNRKRRRTGPTLTPTVQSIVNEADSREERNIEETGRTTNIGLKKTGGVR